MGAVEYGRNGVGVGWDVLMSDELLGGEYRKNRAPSPTSDKYDVFPFLVYTPQPLLAFIVTGKPIRSTFKVLCCTHRPT